MHLWKGRDFVIVDRASEAEALWRAKGYLPESEIAPTKAIAAPAQAPRPEPVEEPAAPLLEPIAPSETELAPKPVPMRRVGGKKGAAADES